MTKSNAIAAQAGRLLIVILAGLLIFYHLYTLHDLYLGAGSAASLYYDHLQSALRVVIVIGLVLVLAGKRIGLWGMWIGISGLVATHYWAHFGQLPVDFTEGRHPLSYLRGFIFPTIISVIYWRFGPPLVAVGRAPR